MSACSCLQLQERISHNDFVVLDPVSKAANSFATIVPRFTFDEMSALLAMTLLPWDSFRIRDRTNGVLSFPVMPCSSASRTAWSIMPSISSLARAAASGTGLANSSPDEREREV